MPALADAGPWAGPASIEEAVQLGGVAAQVYLSKGST